MKYSGGDTKEQINRKIYMSYLRADGISKEPQENQIAYHVHETTVKPHMPEQTRRCPTIQDERFKGAPDIDFFDFLSRLLLALDLFTHTSGGLELNDEYDGNKSDYEAVHNRPFVIWYVNLIRYEYHLASLLRAF